MEKTTPPPTVNSLDDVCIREERFTLSKPNESGRRSRTEVIHHSDQIFIGDYEGPVYDSITQGPLIVGDRLAYVARRGDEHVVNFDGEELEFDADGKIRKLGGWLARLVNVSDKPNHQRILINTPGNVQHATDPIQGAINLDSLTFCPAGDDWFFTSYHDYKTRVHSLKHQVQMGPAFDEFLTLLRHDGEPLYGGTIVEKVGSNQVHRSIIYHGPNEIVSTERYIKRVKIINGKVTFTGHHEQYKPGCHVAHGDDIYGPYECVHDFQEFQGKLLIFAKKGSGRWQRYFHVFDGKKGPSFRFCGPKDVEEVEGKLAYAVRQVGWWNDNPRVIWGDEVTDYSSVDDLREALEQPKRQADDFFARET
ncbi:hypothetical protein ACFL0V_03080 [Nanoarchaeota archaeon]